MLIIATVIAAWIAIIALVVAITVAAARGDEALAKGDPRARIELAAGIVVLDGALAPSAWETPARRSRPLELSPGW
jgi:hypothetical protein